ncbi:hypothetical protein LuPra_02050 [Luteitalea pratensis]|uniref:DUF4139 domain-containing protein n=1 Tax=Luteitalea pratensis TaxID=1855912 RepID=A0A143PM44_LUTPR|nr:hypothetical protein [Luteitalea pratensis]AMY08844.1 hypothetical protein LuPra_02050 [Luteitalea pratensis]
MLLLATASSTSAQGPATVPPGPAAPRTRASDRTEQGAVLSPPDAARLPVRRVVLYKSGVGYFEHLGRVRGDQAVSIDLTSGQLDDVLKSLTTADLGNGRVTGITFNSSAPVEQRLRMLGLPLGASTSPADLLNALRGARVEVQAGSAAIVGRILSLEERQRTADGATETRQELTIVTDAGLVRTFTLGPAIGIRLAEAEMRGELSQYLDLVGSTRARDVRRLRIGTTGSGVRDLLVSYVSEVPVWKSTYRLVIPSAGNRAPFLQGWAIVDNTLGEDWTDVELSLVAGAPQSFVQQVSQPLYTRRPVVPLPRTAMLTPQTHDGTLEAFAKAESVEGGIPGGALGGVVGGLPSAPNAAPVPAPLKEARSREDAVVESLAAAPVAARGQELGDLFQYTLTQPITVRRNQSALVPIVQADVAIERVSLWNAASGTGRPWRAVWLTNDTGLTLDGGSVALVEGGAFAGEGLLEAIQPKERRLISYAVDLAARVSVVHDGGPRRVSRMRIGKGAFVQVVQERVTSTYTIRNEDSTARTFVIEHARRDGWSLAAGTATPAEATAAQHRFRVVVDPRASTELKVEQVREVETRVAVTTITSDQIALILQGRDVDASVAPQLRAVMAQNAEVTRLQSAVRERRAEIERIEKDQARVRENLAALKTSAEERQLVARYASQLNTQEDRLVVLRRDIEDLELQRVKAQDELVRLANAVALDITME